MRKGKMYRATPHLHNDVGVEYFALLRDATAYLNKYTGTTMSDIEWKAISKILKLDRRGIREYSWGKRGREVGYYPICLVGPGIHEKKIFDL